MSSLLIDIVLSVSLKSQETNIKFELEILHNVRMNQLHNVRMNQL